MKSKSKGKSCAHPGKCYSPPPTPMKFKSRDLSGTNPEKEQFEPTDSVPISQRHRMAGAG